MRVFFTKTISVYRLAAANSKESYALNGTINGFIVPMGAEDAFLSEGNPAQQYKLITDYASDVKKTDKLTYDGDDYIITGNQKFDFGAIRRVEAILEKFNS
jgi:hypothetical protein